jgi:hypothetical protein
MKISGFTFLKNANKLFYPIEESILSILDLVDEFVVALGQGDGDDTSLEILLKINSPKLKIINTIWDFKEFPNGSTYAQQTDIAKEACTGDWLFYLQGDELIHESQKERIKIACNKYLNATEVEGFVFDYLHFWGDYEHYFSDHCWYKKEIRIIRNLPEIHSWKDAQSFRWIPDFKGNDYFRTDKTRKLNCVNIEVDIFHYGWVRPPQIMKNKENQANQNYNLKSKKDSFDINFDYGRMDYCKIYKKTHPALMQQRIKNLNWKNLLRYNGIAVINRHKMKHEKLKYRILIWIEEKILNGYVIGGFKNYKLLNKI